MVKAVVLFVLFGISGGIAGAQSIYGYNPAVNSDNILLSASLSFNTTAPMVQRQFGASGTAKGAVSTVPAIGFQYHKSIGERLSARVGFSFGYTSNAFRYAEGYDSLSPGFTPLLKTDYNQYVKVKTGSAYLQPQLDLGYIFGPVKDMYLIEVRAGLGFQVNLGKSSDSSTVTDGGVTTDKNTFTYKYHIYQSAYYGRVDAFGSLVTNLYAGLRWQKTTSEFLNRFSLGLQVTLPMSNAYSGYGLLEYKNDKYEVFTREKVYFSQCSFGVKAAINLVH